jgi:hypothetical protein
VNDDFLALFQKIRDQLRTTRSRPMVPVSVPALTVLWTPSSVVAAPAISPSAARGILHARTEIVANSRFPWLLALRRWAFGWHGKTAFGRSHSCFRLHCMFGFFERMERLLPLRFGVRLVFVCGGLNVMLVLLG